MTNTTPALLSNEQLAAHLAALLEWVALADPSLNLYALLEPGLDPEIAKASSFLDATALRLFDGLPEAGLGDRSPLLIHGGRVADLALSPPLASALDSLVALTRRAPCVSWVLSPLELEKIGAHFRHWLNGRLLDATGEELGEVLLRYTDPRVLPGFMKMLTVEQYGELFRPVSRWGVWLRSETWREWRAPEHNPPQFTPPLNTYSLKQQGMLEQATRTDRILARIEEQAASSEADDPLATAVRTNFLDLAYDARFRQLDAVLAHASREGLQEDADFQFYSWLRLAFGHRFDEHPSVIAALKQCQTEGITFLDAAAALTIGAHDMPPAG